MYSYAKYTYYCEYCDEKFNDKEKCKAHEETHNINYEFATSKEVAAELNSLADNAWSYHINDSVMGRPYESLVSLFRTASKRLEEMED